MAKAPKTEVAQMETVGHYRQRVAKNGKGNREIPCLPANLNFPIFLSNFAISSERRILSANFRSLASNQARFRCISLRSRLE